MAHFQLETEHFWLHMRAELAFGITIAVVCLVAYLSYKLWRKR